FVNASEGLGGGKPKGTRLTPLSAESIARKRARSASADEPTRLDPKIENSKLGSAASRASASAPASQPSGPARPAPSRWDPPVAPVPPPKEGSRPKVEVEVEPEEDRPSTTRATQAVALKSPSPALLA